MSNAPAFGTKKNLMRGGIGATAAMALVVGAFAAQAAASGPAFGDYDEGDSPNPLPVTNGLVFYTGADMGWTINEPISAINSLSYTVATGSTTKWDSHGVALATGYAPSYQLVVSATIPDVVSHYARLVWEPYMQAGSLDPVKGSYTNLEDGVWWTSKIGNPALGSQSHPMPLSFFTESYGAGWTDVTVGAIAIHQGTTSDTSSVVTSVTYNGDSVPLGNADATPFNQNDVDAAVAAATGPLNDEIDGLNDANGTLTSANAALTTQVTSLQGQLATAQGAVTTLQGQLTTANSQLTTANTQLITANGLLSAAQSQAGDALGDKAALLEQIGDLQDQVADLEGQVSDLEDQVSDLGDDLADAQDQVASLTDELSDAQDALAAEEASHASDTTELNSTITGLNSQIVSLNTQVTALNGQVVAGQDALTAYQGNHHTADGSSIGESRALLSATPTHGKAVGVKLSGSIAKATAVHYQWYLSGKAVVGATKSTYAVPSTAKGKSVSVKVTGTYKNIVFAVHTNTLAAK